MNSIRERRRDSDPLLDWLRRSEPLGDHPASVWSRTPQAAEMIRRITEGVGETASPRPVHTSSRRGTRLALPAVAVLVLGAGVAGANALWGGPTPASVTQDLSGVDQGMPADLRFNPDVQNAHLVAQSEGARLYAAGLPDGGYCTEIVWPDGRPGGAVCHTAAELASIPISVTAPFVDPITLRSPIVVGGRVNTAGATSLEAAFTDGSTRPVALGENGAYVLLVPDDHLAEAHRLGFTLVATGADGSQLASADVPATDFSDPAAQDAKQPIFVSTISTHEDFTLVLGIEGSVNVAGATSLELRYPDGTVTDVPLNADGTYRYRLPDGRQDDLAEHPGLLVARDAHGRQVATQPVASVAYWRSG